MYVVPIQCGEELLWTLSVSERKEGTRSPRCRATLAVALYALYWVLFFTLPARIAGCFKMSIPRPHP